MACDNEGEKLFYAFTDGEYVACDEIYVFKSGQWEPVCNVYASVLNPVTEELQWDLVYPTINTNTSDIREFGDKWFTLCKTGSVRGDGLWEAFDDGIMYTPEPNPSPGQGLGKSLWHFSAYGYDSNSFNPYGSFKWQHIETPTYPIFDRRDWGFFGTVVRRVPNINTTAQNPTAYEELLWVRPSLAQHLSDKWWASTGAIFKWGNEEVANDTGTQIQRVLNVPSISADKDYYEYRGQKNKGLVDQTTHDNNPDCCRRTSRNRYSFRSYESSTPNQPDFAAFAEDYGPFANGSFVGETASSHFPLIEETVTQNNSGKWSVWEVNATTTNNTNVHCGPGGGHPCHMNPSNEQYAIEKEYIVAFHANKVGGTGSAFNPQTHLNSAISSEGGAAAFYAENGPWISYDGGGDIFLFIRYRTPCFSRYHTAQGNYVAPPHIVKEFWINPSAWSKVNGGTPWPSGGDFIGMVMDVVPASYEDACQPSFPDHMARTLPKYYYWNVPLNVCPLATPSNSIIGYSWLTNNTGSSPGEGWAWGTPTGFEAWTSSTGKQDLLGAGVGTGDYVNNWGTFDPIPSAVSDYDGPHPAYSFDLYSFNKDFGSLDGFPYGVGHGYGLKTIAPAPWCPCTLYQEPTTQTDSVPPPPMPPGEVSAGCPCGHESNGSGEWTASGGLAEAGNTFQCCNAYAQQTQFYMISKTVIEGWANPTGYGLWDTSEWTGSTGVPETVVWRQQCGLIPVPGCTGCGGIDCQECGEPSESPFCKSCCECERVCNYDPYCCEVDSNGNPTGAWDSQCVDYYFAFTSFIEYCADPNLEGAGCNPNDPGDNEWVDGPPCVCQG